MKIEIDQSNRVENAGRTVLAFSNEITDAVVIPFRAKRVGFQILRARLKPRKLANLLLFSAGIFLLLEGYLEKVTEIVIDLEYEGREADIRAFLLRYIWRRYPGFDSERIKFRSIGKSSRAHKKAWSVFRNRDKQTRKITARELRDLLE